MNATPTPETVVVKSLCGYSVSATLCNPGSDNPVVIREVLTECCEAATTGTTDGVACKGCGKLVDEMRAGGGLSAIEYVAHQNGCPEPLNCADHMIWTIDRELRVE